MQLSILGTIYNVETRDGNEDRELKDRLGYCFFDKHEIVLADLGTLDEWKDEPQPVKEHRTKNVLRHEIIHAYLFESGLGENSSGTETWAMNEEMVDWYAIQSPKIYKTFREAGCL